MESEDTGQRCVLHLQGRSDYLLRTKISAPFYSSNSRMKKVKIRVEYTNYILHYLYYKYQIRIIYFSFLSNIVVHVS